MSSPKYDIAFTLARRILLIPVICSEGDGLVNDLIPHPLDGVCFVSSAELLIITLESHNTERTEEEGTRKSCVPVTIRAQRRQLQELVIFE